MAMVFKFVRSMEDSMPYTLGILYGEKAGKHIMMKSLRFGCGTLSAML
jgi:hypothetical protein